MSFFTMLEGTKHGRSLTFETEVVGVVGVGGVGVTGQYSLREREHCNNII